MVVIHNETDVALTLKGGPQYLHVAARANTAVPPSQRRDSRHVGPTRSVCLKRNEGKDIWLSMSCAWKLLFLGFSRANGSRPRVLGGMSWSRLPDHTGLCHHRRRRRRGLEKKKRDVVREEARKKKNSQMAINMLVYQNSIAPSHHHNHISSYSHNHCHH